MEMNHDRLMALLDQLIEECHPRGIEGTIAIYEGTAMSYHMPGLRTTQDVDSTFRPFNAIQDAAHAVAERNGIPTNWLNMQIHDVMPPKSDDAPVIYHNSHGLKVMFASKPYLLAMKAMSDRRSQKDLDDAARLFNALHLDNWMDIDALVHQYYGAGSARAQELFFEDIEERAAELAATAGK